MSNILLPENIINLDKKNYNAPEIILGEKDGIFDTINKSYPELWKLYKSQCSMDWDANEFDYSPCNVQFKTCERHIYDMMIKNLAWQWETDGIAAKVFINVLSNVCTSTEAWAGWLEIAKIESTHSEAYSEIVRNSFDDPSEVLQEVLRVREAQERLVVISRVFEDARIASLKYGLGMILNDQELFNKIYLFLVAVLCMERIQFMGSFAVTFGICESTGLFMPAGKAIQKIAQDEFDIHVHFGKEVLKQIYKTPRGQIAFEQTRPQIIQLLNEVVGSEIDWVSYAFSEGRELTGVTAEMMVDWDCFGGTDIAHFFGIEDEVNFPLIETNPLKFMESWISIDKVQASAQEEDLGAYKVNTMQRDDDGEIFDIDL